MHQKFVNNFSLDISTVVPKWLKKFFVFLFAGQIGIGPFLNAIGGKGKALTIVALTFIYFLSWEASIVEMKFIIVCEDLKFKFFNILLPTSGVIDKKIQFDLLIISWLSFNITIFLLFFLSCFDIFLLRSEI